jgi:LPXTG-site transpeptidase (sortase) family protein
MTNSAAWQGYSVLHRFIVPIIVTLLLISSLFYPQILVSAAAPHLSIDLITWGMVGLDSNDPMSGPNNFPVGAHVCNDGDAIALEVTSNWTWDSENAFINNRENSITSFTGTYAHPSLAPGACYDFYYEISITKVSAAFDTYRNFHITASINGSGLVQTPTRQLYVEHLISQNRNSTSAMTLDGNSIPVGGSMNMVVGNTYEIVLYANTATQGYNQIETFINFPNSVFRILEVHTHYSADSSPYVTNPNPFLYGDACLWDDNQNSPTYRSCIGGDYKAGGTIEMHYLIEVIHSSSDQIILTNLIYDFSGSSFHYNSDYSVGARIVNIIDPTTLTIAKTFTPSTTTVGGVSRLTFTLHNPNAASISGANFTDDLPPYLSVASLPNATTSNCGTSAVFNPQPGNTSLSFSNGSIPASGDCLVSVNVTPSQTGTLTNTSNNLFIGDVDTLDNASAQLIVNTAPPTPACVPNLIMAEWTMAPATTPPNPPTPSLQAGNVSVANALAGAGITGNISTSTGNPVNSWTSYGYSSSTTLSTANNDYIELQIDSSHYSQLALSFQAQRVAAGPRNLWVYYSTSSSGPFTAIGSALTVANGSWTTYPVNLSSVQNTTGVTYIRIYGYNANNDQQGADIFFDNIRFTGCSTPAPVTITKTFNQPTVAVNGISTLTFTLSNPNSISVSGVRFTDTLPNGVAVASTPSASTTCTGTPTWSPTAGSSSLSFGSPTGATITANTSCTVTVNVIVSTPGIHTNISGYVNYSYFDGSTTQTATNYTPSGSATAEVAALLAPAITKSFSPGEIPVNQTSRLSFIIENPNLDTQLTGVTFTDLLPAGITFSPGMNTSQCGGTLSVTQVSGRDNLTFTGGTVLAGNFCTIAVDVTSSTVGTYLNTTSTVDADIVNAEYYAEDTLDVTPVHPAVSIIKQISLMPEFPSAYWLTYLAVPSETPVYYRFTVENTGDVPLDRITVSDPALTALEVNLDSCSWDSVPLYDTQYCVVGPIDATEVTFTNTATATATYFGVDFPSSPVVATYATTGLSLDKSVEESYFTIAGQTIHFNFDVTNSGAAPLSGTIVINDDHTSSTTCPLIETVGDLDEFLDPEEIIRCTGTYIVTEDDVTAGLISNTASVSLGGVTSNEDTAEITLYMADLQLTKENDTSDVGYLGIPFNWTIIVLNTGPVDAVFENGDTFFSDQLPAGATYALSTFPANTECAIDTDMILTCYVTGDPVTIPSTTGSLAFSVQVTPTQIVTLENTATANPDSDVIEATHTNNDGSDQVTISSPDLRVIKTNTAGNLVDLSGTFEWQLEVVNFYSSAASTAVFEAGETILQDDLTSGITYGTITVTDGVTPPEGTGTAYCYYDSSTIYCSAQGGTVTLAPGASFTVSFPVSDLSQGVLSNPSTDGGAVCQVDPNNTIDEALENNNTCSDSVTVVVPPLISKTFNSSTVLLGDTSTLDFTLTNPNTTTTLTGVAFTDDLPDGITVETGTASVCGGTLETTSPDSIMVSGVTLAPGEVCNFSVSFTAAARGTLSNITSTITSDQTSAGLTASDSVFISDPSLDLVKTITSGDPYYIEGDLIYYEYTVTNDGNTIQTGPITINDDLTTATCDAINSVGNENDNFEPGESLTCHSSYSIQALDVSNGSVTNIATAHSNEVTSNETSATAYSALIPSLILLKQVGVSSTGPWDTLQTIPVGDDVYYSFTITNSGDVSLSNITLLDDTLDVSSCSFTDPLPADQSTTCIVGPMTATTGDHINTATAQGDYLSHTYYSPESSASYFGSEPGIAIIKEVAVSDGGPFDDTGVTLQVGDTVYYRVTVSNTGNTPLTSVVVSDDTCTLSTHEGDTNSDNILDLTEQWVYTCSMTAEAGTHTNTASSHSVETPVDVTDSAGYFGEYVSIGIAKNADSVTYIGSGVYEVVYTFMVQNYGNVDLENIHVSDDLRTTFPSGNIFTIENLISSDFTVNPSFNGSLDTDLLYGGDALGIGETGTITLTIHVTPTEPGVFYNTAVASGTSGSSIYVEDSSEEGMNPDSDGDEDPTDNNTPTETTLPDFSPALTLLKQVGTTASGPWFTSTTAQISSDVYYLFTITNTGDVPLSSISLTDPDLDASGCSFTDPLAVDESTTCIIGPVNAEIGTHTNTATADALYTTDPVTSLESSATYFGTNAGISITKEIAITAIGPWQDTSITVTNGNTVYYRITVDNTGNIPLTNVAVSDDTCSLSAASGDTNSNNELDLTEHWVYTCAVTAQPGAHTNTAGVLSAETPTEVTDTASYFGQDPLIGLGKDMQGVEYLSGGMYSVTYQFHVQNYGNIPLSNVQINDDLLTTYPAGNIVSVYSLTSSTLTINETFDGVSQTNLLDGSDTLDVNESGTVTLVLHVVPSSHTTYNNSASASGISELEVTATDDSCNGLDPDPSEDGDPTNDTSPTPVDFEAGLLDPPSGIKWMDDNNIPILEWTMVWINNSNFIGIDAEVSDSISENTTFYQTGVYSGYPLPSDALPGSSPNGVSCTDTSALTTTTACYYEIPTIAYPGGRIIWRGNIGPDYGITDPDLAANEIHITFNVTVDESTFSVENTAYVSADRNQDGNLAGINEIDVADASGTWTSNPNTLPDGGFAPNQVTQLTNQPQSYTYSHFGSLWLEIPRLGVETNIVGVPFGPNGWDITWLGANAGWLNGTAFPTWSGNSAITGHVYLSNGQPGPFSAVGNLVWGDRVIIHFNGLRYVYEVRNITQVDPDDMSVLGHEEDPWLTLITCRGYDEISNSYAYRVAVQAVLIRVEVDINGAE